MVSRFIEVKSKFLVLNVKLANRLVIVDFNFKYDFVRRLELDSVLLVSLELLLAAL